MENNKLDLNVVDNGFSDDTDSLSETRARSFPPSYPYISNWNGTTSNVCTTYKFNAGRTATMSSYYGFYISLYRASDKALMKNYQGVVSAAGENTETPSYDYYLCFTVAQTAVSTSLDVR
ncbi:MAG: hypothetical protein LBT44_07890 [Clostridiales bacterium]|jgi:hypothetical protein|nr:hypothetical protein [Clostridiales bacterium]